jgi:hypothetical protein
MTIKQQTDEIVEKFTIFNHEEFAVPFAITHVEGILEELYNVDPFRILKKIDTYAEILTELKSRL